MASALHIKDSFVAILINLGNTSRRTTHFDEGSGFQLSLSPEKADVASRPVRRAALKKAPASTPRLFRGRLGPPLASSGEGRRGNVLLLG